MSGRSLDQRPARTTATIAGVVAAAVVLTVGWAAGSILVAVLAVVGSSLLAVGAWGLEAPERTRQAGGSVAATAGAALLFGLLVLAVTGRGGWILVALSIGLALVAVDAAIGFEWEQIRSLTSVMMLNGKAVVVGIVAVTVLYLLVAFGVLQAILAGILTISTASSLTGLVTLQLLALATVLAIPRTVSLLERWVGGDGDAATGSVINSVESLGFTLWEVPRIYWIALGGQLVAVVIPVAHAIFDRFFGAVLGPVLTSGVLHGLVGVVLLTLLVIFGAAVLRRWLIAWLGAIPAQTVALQAGGLTSILVAVLVGLVLEYLPDSRILDFAVPLFLGGRSAAVFPVIVLTIVGVALLTVLLLLEVGPAVARLGFASERTTGFALGSALLFLGTIGAAGAGAPAVVVFVGVGGALLTWDLGSHASSVGLHLGQEADTRRSEFVHVTGSTLVLGAGVAVATLAAYVVVPATAPAGTQEMAGRAAISMVLVLVALLAFVTAVHLRGRATDSG